MLTYEQFCNYIDHTRSEAGYHPEIFIRLCEEAEAYRFKAVAGILPAAEICCQKLAESPVLYCAAVAFPSGHSTLPAKLQDIKWAIEHGADEVDYVLNLYQLAAGNYSLIEEEMQAAAELCRSHQITDKVIIETCYLTIEQKIRVCEIAAKVQPCFLKTSTGHGPSGAVAADVRLMKSIVGDQVKIKAAGGIKTCGQMLEMIAAGADRIGTSSGISIAEEYKKQLEGF